MKGLSLFSIESAIHALMDAWQEAETPEALVAAEAALVDYAAAEVQKVDGIRDYMEFCKLQAENSKAQAKQYTERARLWSSRYERLADFVQTVMVTFGKPKLIGSHGQFVLRGNGGLQPLTIASEGMIPDDCCRWVGAIPAALWKSVVEQLDPDTRAVLSVTLRREVSESAVRAALGTPEGCPGAHLEPRGQHLRIA